MDAKQARHTAVFVDGGFYRVRSKTLWGKKSAKERAAELYDYCLKHIEDVEEPRDLYRIFYYDCPPMQGTITHPLTGKTINFAEEPSAKWSTGFHAALATKRKVALRMGELAETQAVFAVKGEIITEIIKGKRDLSDLTERDFYIDVKQKGVDMRIGLDTASLAYGRYVDQIILIAGDSDFIPVAKMARRHGIDFLLDPMLNFVKPRLLEHVDGTESFC